MGRFAHLRWLGLALLLTTILYGIVYLAFPRQDLEFPLNDEWAFAPMAYRVAQGAGLNYDHWPSMPFLGQLALTAPFVWAFGASLMTLRFATLLFALLAAVAFYDLLRQGKISEKRAAFITFVMATSPVYYISAHLYMTDLWALAFCLGALAIYGRAAERQSLPLLLVGTGVAILAAITRQNTVLIPLAFLPLCFSRFAPTKRLAALGIVALPIVAGIATHFWFNARTDIQPMEFGLGGETLGLKVLRLGLLSVRVLLPVGLWIAPVVVLTARRVPFRPAAIPLLILVGMTGFMAFSGWWYPYEDNYISAYGIYPASTFMGQRPVVLDFEAQVGLTFAALLSAVYLVACVCNLTWERLRQTPLLLFSLLNLGLLTLMPYLLDRYYLALLPGALYLVAVMAKEHVPATAPEQEATAEPTELVNVSGTAGQSGRRRVYAGAVAAGFSLLSVVLMHDWFAWNAAFWRLGNRTIAQGVAGKDIAGTWEWNCYHGLLRRGPLASRHAPKNSVSDSEAAPISPEVFARALRVRPGGYENRTAYLGIAFSPMEGTGTVVRDVEPYTLWMKRGDFKVYLLANDPNVPFTETPSEGLPASPAPSP
jgi:4-amino-4-deoxy-L-arabinose transferase-like glycosyltransferase